MNLEDLKEIADIVGFEGEVTEDMIDNMSQSDEEEEKEINSD